MRIPLLAGALLCLHSVAGQPVERYAVLITEVMADPSPTVGLPAVEFLELRNVGRQTVDLDRWRVADAAGSALISGTLLLAPDSQVVVCPRTQAAELQRFGRTVGVASFPSLDNDGETLVLLAPDGRTMHAVTYQKSWYGNTLKAEGGWSLEMIDPGLPCAGPANWSASQSPSGGTPGHRNSIDGRRTDTEPPAVRYAYSTDSLTLVLCLGETVDSASASLPARYRGLDGLGSPVRARPTPPHFDRIALTLDRPMQPRTVYRLEVDGLKDCRGNTLPAPVIRKAGLSSPPGPGQLRINEVLFDPRPDGTDHVELFNRGPGILDAATLLLANRNGNGPAANPTPCSRSPRPIFPGDHPTFTADSAATTRQYRVTDPDMLFPTASLPTYPDDAGTVVVLDAAGRECDAFAYRATDHFPLLSRREGVALERIDPATPTQDRSNWHSAASDAGHATPTARNSQYRPTDIPAGHVSIQPDILSPDMDGVNDHLTLTYRFAENGWTCSIIITDAAGRPLRHVTRNALCGREGRFGWDGLDDNGGRVPPGICYLVMEAVDTRGRRRTWRKGIVMAYRR